MDKSNRSTEQPQDHGDRVETDSKFTIAPLHMLDHEQSGLSHVAVRLYLAIRSFTSPQKMEAFPSRERLAKMLGVSTRTVTSAIKELQDGGWLGVEHRFNTSNLYTLKDHGTGWKQASIWKHTSTQTGNVLPDRLEAGFSLTRTNELEPLNKDNCSTSNDVQRSPNENDSQQDGVKSFSMDVQQLCSLLADWIIRNGARPPNITNRWLTDMDRLMRIDGASRQEIETIIDWCQQDSFWHQNILSPGKLRKQWDRLVLGSKALNNRRVNPNANVIDTMLAEQQNEMYETQRKELDR